MAHSQLPDKEFHRTLPKKRIAAGALFFNANGEILLLQTSYKTHWEIPGGIVEANESPREACHREMIEEIGLAKKVKRLLVVDYLNENEQRLEIILFIFLGGTLSVEEIANIKVDEEEILTFGFFTLSEAQSRIAPDLYLRVKAALDARQMGATDYLEEGIL